MNERIQALIYQLNNEVGIHWTNEDKIKFAELILKECADICDDNNNFLQAKILKKHFGVE